MPLQPGQVVDRYVVERLLGEGGMAAVYLVRHQSLGTLRALKLLHSPSRRMVQRMAEEARILATLDHPNLVRVLDTFEVEGSPAILMEFVDGPTLDGLLARGRLPLPEAQEIFLGVLAGVEHAHAAGIIHRDLKPGNILLSRSGGHWHARVADFGIARVVDDVDGERTGPRLTRTGTPIGTPAYMAPEQIRDASRADRRADIFALGCVLYELVTGERTWPQEDWLATCTAITEGRYRPARTLAPELPQPIDAAIRRCLATDPAERPPDCAHLRALATDEPATSDRAARIPAETTNAVKRGPPTGPSLTRRLAAVAVIVVSVGVAWLSTRPGPSDADSPITTADPPASPPPAPTPAGLSVSGDAFASPTHEAPEPAAHVSARDVAQPESGSGRGITGPPPNVASALSPDVAPAEPEASADRASPAGNAPVLLGRIVVDGADTVAVLDAGGSAASAEGVRDGHYTVRATWGSRTASVGVDVTGGRTVWVACREDFGECRVR